MAIPLIGYSDRLSVRPGDTIEFKVSSHCEAPFTARLVRSISADPNPAGPGIVERAVEAHFAGSYPSRVQAFYPGSYARIEGAIPAGGDGSFTLAATIWPTRPGLGEQAVLSCGDVVLLIGASGAIEGRAGAYSVMTDEPLRDHSWYRVWLSYDAGSGAFSAGQAPVGSGNPVTATARADGLSLAGQGPILIAARDGAAVTAHFNGKIEAPALYGSATAAASDLIAQWDFARAVSSTRIEDSGPHGLHGRLVNLPTRAMTGSTWNGEEMCWRHAPEQYAAIHFHEDDIYDFGWETDFRFTVPDDLPSGIYVARVTCGQHEDAMPFFVCPPKGKRTADLCVLVSTFTYVIYGNHARPDFEPSWKERIAAWQAYPWNPAEHPEYGLSTYNAHSDGSGICHASHKRPLFNLRPGYLTFGTGEGSGLRHFQADSHLISWLDAKGIAYDIVTDQELHDEGVAAVAGYRALITGTHPEYHSKQTLDALEAYRDQGGRFCYLGGNGFYWRVATHEEEKGTIEIRRGEGGIRAWAAEPGEYYNAFDGAYGGLWRRSGRPPQRIAGIGFSAQGQFEGSYYRRKPEADDPRVAWIFEGIEEEILGDFGLSGGGAAGYELDRVERRLGSPDGITVLASSEGHGPSFVLVPEEQLTHITTWSGAAVAELIRADMVYYETASGGAVFASGSITFCGSLPHNDFDNDISRLLLNVLRRFLEK